MFKFVVLINLLQIGGVHGGKGKHAARPILTRGSPSPLPFGSCSLVCWGEGAVVISKYLVGLPRDRIYAGIAVVSPPFLCSLKISAMLTTYAVND